MSSTRTHYDVELYVALLTISFIVYEAVVWACYAALLYGVFV